VTDTRHKDVQWRLREEGKTTGDGDSTYSYEHIHTALLMDIRDELKAMNAKLAVLGCSSFLRIPWTLSAIKANTTRRKKRATVRAIKRTA
jgi:hypothetical protein